jgi:hypothetical protein
VEQNIWRLVLVNMTMINFRRTGGNPVDELSLDLDLSTLSANAEQRFERLLEDTNFFGIPFVRDLPSDPDEYAYSVTVVAGNRLHTVHATDTSMPRSLRPLIEQLTDLARAAS